MVAAMMLVGEREEPFLDACLSSLATAVDWLVVNDNSSSGRHRETVERSVLGQSGRIDIVPSPFLGFGPCRMVCIAALRARADERWWVLKVDSDEVHHDGLRVLTREVLPCLPPGAGVVDGYAWQLCPSPSYALGVDRRHDLLFRFAAGIEFAGDVHERMVNARGRRVAVPYRYFHYGYVAPLARTREKWQQYGDLGDPISGSQAARVAEVVAGDARRARRYAGSHPPAVAAALQDYTATHRPDIDWFESLARSVPPWRHAVATLGWRASLGVAAARWAPRASASAPLRRALTALVRLQRALEAAR